MIPFETAITENRSSRPESPRRMDALGGRRNSEMNLPPPSPTSLRKGRADQKALFWHERISHIDRHPRLGAGSP
ncbi:hypothetical protein L209DRAFT_53327 [Thermothelomyces heterothallicus CBS 203.75]